MAVDTVLLAVLIAWPVIGISLALILGRRGHDALGWLLLGALFGPFAVLLAVDSVEHDEGVAADVLASPVHRPGGTLDVLVGFDGSEGARAAVAYAQRVFAGRLDRLTLVDVVPYDGGLMDEREARVELEEARRVAPGAGLEVVHGRPAVALQDLARQEGYDLLVIGTSRDDRLHVFGDAPVDLARESAMPVLLVPHSQPGEDP